MYRKKDLLEIFFFARSLQRCKQKNHRYQRWFVCRSSELPTLYSEGNCLVRDESPKLSFQCSRTTLLSGVNHLKKAQSDFHTDSSLLMGYILGNVVAVR